MRFVGIEDSRIAAAYIMSHEHDLAYDTVDWQTELPDSEVVTLHALRVLPNTAGGATESSWLVMLSKQREEEDPRLSVWIVSKGTRYHRGCIVPSAFGV